MENLYRQYKALLFTLAYQLTGSVSDAEDAVQDVFLKVHGIDPDRLSNPKAYLCKMITNRCLDVLRSARKRREQYFGEWLPVPVLTSEDQAIEGVVTNELLSYAMLVLLERLTPAERAVFVLREALAFDYSDIAGLVGTSEVHCRKLLSRAKGKMGIAPEARIQPEASSEEWVRRLLGALHQGKIDAVVSMLAEDIVLISDGGGKRSAAAHPIQSREFVARFLFGITGKAPLYEEGAIPEIAEINGQTGLIFRSGAGIEVAALLHAEGEFIHNIYLIRNPDKLVHLTGRYHS